MLPGPPLLPLLAERCCGEHPRLPPPSPTSSPLLAGVMASTRSTSTSAPQEQSLVNLMLFLKTLYLFNMSFKVYIEEMRRKASIKKYQRNVS